MNLLIPANTIPRNTQQIRFCSCWAINFSYLQRKSPQHMDKSVILEQNIPYTTTKILTKISINADWLKGAATRPALAPPAWQTAPLSHSVQTVPSRRYHLATPRRTLSRRATTRTNGKTTRTLFNTRSTPLPPTPLPDGPKTATVSVNAH